MTRVIEQRGAVGMVLAAIHLADKEQVIALFMLAQIAAFKDRGAAFQQGHAMFGVMVGGMEEAVYTLACKQLGQRLLRGRQHMNGVMRAVAEHGQRIGMLTQAPEHQRRCQRHGIERADGGSHRMTLCTARRDDGHASGELPQRIAKFALREGQGRTQDGGRQGRVHEISSTKRRPQRRATVQFQQSQGQLQGRYQLST